MATDLERLVVRINADSTQLRAELAKIDQAGRRAGSTIGTAFGGVGRVFVNAGNQAAALSRRFLNLRSVIGTLAGSGGLGLLGRSALASADALEEQAQAIGTSIEKLQELRFVAAQSGRSVEQFETAMGFLSNGMADAANGTGTAIDALATLKISLTNTDKSSRTSVEALGEVIDKLHEWKNVSERVQMARDLFGRGGETMLTLPGSAGIEAGAAEARRRGAVMTEEMTKSAARANDQLTALGVVLRKNFDVGMIEGFAGSFDKFADRLTDPELANSAHRLGVAMGGFIDKLIANADLILRVTGAFAGARVGGVIGAAGGPVGAAIGAAGGGAAGFFAQELLGIGADAETATAKVSELNSEIAKTRETVRLLNQPSQIAKLADLEAQRNAINDAAISGAGVAGPARDVATVTAGGKTPDPRGVPLSAEARKAAEDAANTRKRATESIDEMMRGLDDEAKLLAISGLAHDQLALRMRAENIVRGTGIELTAEQIDKLDAFAKGEYDAARGAEASAHMIAEQNRQMDEGEALTRSLMTATELYADTLVDLQEKLRAGTITAATFDRAQEEARRTVLEATPEYQHLADAAEGIGDAFGNAAQDLMMGRATILEAVASLAAQIQETLARELVSEPISEWIKAQLMGGVSGGGGGGIGGLFAGLFGAGGGGGLSSASTAAIQATAAADIASMGIFHEGGVQGALGRISLPAFHGGGAGSLPRLARSLQPDEFMATLRRGETVRTREQEMAISKRSLSATFNVNLTAAPGMSRRDAGLVGKHVGSAAARQLRELDMRGSA